jgi:uncharacterized protein (TIGR04255 family)
LLIIEDEEEFILTTETGFERQYKQPRILEALCELQFVPSSDWNTSVYGTLLAAIRDLGFEQTEELPRFTIQIAPPMKEPEIKSDHFLMRYKHSDENWLLQLSSDSFTVNQLAPYPGWEAFKPRILEAVKRFTQALPTVQTRRIVLRYINHFEFEGRTIDLTEWFTIYPTVPLISEQKGPFLLRQEFLLANNDVIAATAGLAYPAAPNRIAILLDLEYQREPEASWDMEQFKSILDMAHQAVYHAFELFITDRTRELLEEVK